MKWEKLVLAETLQRLEAASKSFFLGSRVFLFKKKKKRDHLYSFTGITRKVSKTKSSVTPPPKQSYYS